jgi:hypothetical protein
VHKAYLQYYVATYEALVNAKNALWELRFGIANYRWQFLLDFVGT